LSNGFTVQSKGARQSLLSSSWFRVLLPVLVVLVMAGGVVGFGLYRQYRISKQGPWLEANSTPAGATVLVNGRWVGATPLRLEPLEEGMYAVRFEKDGHEAVVRQIQLQKPGLSVSVELERLSSGRIVVNVEPKGAEVLLDGVLVGHTPVTLNTVVGPHELIVRKSNFQSFIRRLHLKADETQTFQGVALVDLVLKALRERCRLEPWRISNATELATYLFLSGSKLEAAEIVMQAMEESVRSPDFPPEMLPDERANENRLRREDMGRLNHMYARMCSWKGHNTAPFRDRMSQPDGMLKILAFRMRLHSWETAHRTAVRLSENFPRDTVTLATAVRLIYGQTGRSKDGDFHALLRYAEGMARKAYSVDPSAGALAMAEVTASRRSTDETVRFLRESLTHRSPENLWEDRAVRAVTLYDVVGQRDQARSVCQQLLKSERPEIREAATELLKQF